MVVSTKRQELKKSAGRKKKTEFISLEKKTASCGSFQLIHAMGSWFPFLVGMICFFLISGTELPYRFMKPVRITGLNHMNFTEQELPSGAPVIKALKAEADFQMPGVTESEQEKTRLWEVPSFNYRLNKGDTISLISRHYHISVSTILSLNKIENVKKMGEGQVLLIPEIDGILHKVEKDETFESILEHYQIEMKDLLYYNPYIALREGNFILLPEQELFLPGVSLPEQELRSHMGELFIYPVQGTVIKGYGHIQDELTQIESFHNGIDIKGDLGEPVRASLDGKVIARGFNSSYGNYVIIEHGGNYRTLYAHLDKSVVEKNDKVLQGEIIGVLGMSGYARMAHLHFSLFKGKKSIDPLDYLH